MSDNEWKLTVTFNEPLEKQLEDDGPPYSVRLGKVVSTWEHDCPIYHDVDPDSWDAPTSECPCWAKGISYDGETLWEADYTTFTAYSDIIDALEDVVSAAIMNTIPEKLILEQT